MTPALRTYRHGFTLIEVTISAALLVLLMIAVMGILSQAQRDMRAVSAQTQVTEKTRKTMEDISRELRESSINHIVAGARISGAGLLVRNVMSFANEPDMVQCPDAFCPWHYHAGLGAEIEPRSNLVRYIQMSQGTGFSPTSPETNIDAASSGTAGRIWVGINSGDQCPAGHTISSLTSSTVQMGAIMFATPRNREGQFVSQEGANRSTDWQGLVFLVPYSKGGNIVQLRRYVVYIDDLVHDDGIAAWDGNTGVVAPPAGETVSTVSGSGGANGAFSTNNPAGKPTLLNLLDFDGDGATADGVLDITGGTADATTESFTVTTSGSQRLIQYVKQGNADGGSYNFSITIDRENGDTTIAVNHTYPGAAPAASYQKTVTITGRYPQVVAANLRDIEFATIRNCPFDATDNPTGLVVPQDTNVVRITAFFDKLLEHNLSSGTNVKRATSQEVIVTRVQPRN